MCIQDKDVRLRFCRTVVAAIGVAAGGNPQGCKNICFTSIGKGKEGGETGRQGSQETDHLIGGRKRKKERYIIRYSMGNKA